MDLIISMLMAAGHDIEFTPDGSFVGQTDTLILGNAQLGGMATYGNLLVVADSQNSDMNVYCIDITDGNLVLLGSYYYNSGKVGETHGWDIKFHPDGQTAFVRWSDYDSTSNGKNDGVMAIDVSDPSNPNRHDFHTEYSFYSLKKSQLAINSAGDTLHYGTDDGLSGSAADSIAVAWDNSTKQFGAVSIGYEPTYSDPIVMTENDTLVKGYPYSTTIYAGALSHNMVSDSIQFTAMGNLIAVLGKYASTGYPLSIMDISNTSSLVHRSRIDMPGYGSWGAYQKDMLYVLEGGDIIAAYDVSNPDNIVAKSRYTTAFNQDITRMATIGNHIFYSNDNTLISVEIGG